jgi:hypothetical protein
MDDVIFVPIPVSPEAAAVLDGEGRRRRVGKLVSDVLRPSAPEHDPLVLLIIALKGRARAGGFTDEEIEAELAAAEAR